ncbi:hypothetical protein HS041_17905 [Planomonospora sp. ID67723]|uniref:hypothetical protein n=1 Tax=Planomonospora sp. ID67723 TaxID=2738134 RepID=UPI0018C406F4|nr:hypothetical protein [Planomonospora sp. ID67723]MBG0829642.1 hypothetical protein [Planomonospora sp. ID67723]
MSPTPQRTGELPQDAAEDRAASPEAAPESGPSTRTAEETGGTGAAPPPASGGPEAASGEDGAGPAVEDGDAPAMKRAGSEDTAAAAVAEEEKEGGSGSGEAAGARRGSAAWRGRLIGAVVAMAVAGAAVFGAIQWLAAERLADRLSAEKAERLAVSTRAGEFAVALQTYDHANLQAYRDRVFSLSGEDFEQTYNEAFSPLESLITAMKASSTASIRGVYVSEVAEGRAKAVTVVDSQVKSTAGTRRMLGAYMELGLIKTGGEWRVNDATVMGAADELLTDPDGKAIGEPEPSPSPTKKDK